MHAPYSGESYYGRPALKPAPWDWTVSGYIFLAGLAGSAQGLAALGQVADRRRYRGMIANARYLAAASTAAGAALLIADLRTPQRWYNMLRIFRPTSPMSIGTYILGAFGGLTGITLLGEVAGGRSGVGRVAGRAADIAQIGAAVAGAGASTYTAALLSATSTPEWSVQPRRLGLKFGLSAAASGAAALSIGERLSGRDGNADRLDAVATAATLAGMAADALPARESARDVSPGSGRRNAPPGLDAGHLLLGGALPLAAYGLSRTSRDRAVVWSVAGSLAVLAGGMWLRHRTLTKGMRSAEDPRRYFRVAQPGVPAARRPHGPGPSSTPGGEGR
ncbi:NrfD/PsrC family molybdoenzyme membrane anchor subunit [Faunimonas sp. B44]|uniref:NrfD/PsrC family molybdoenzyme membrane anchor subunit n=1 Tax=Faunimonas sp. B44 TaxID=3461493 RepID=UPI004043F25B